MIEFISWLIGGFFAIFGFVYIYYRYNDVRNKITLRLILIFLSCVVCLALIYYYNISYLGVLSYFLFGPLLYYLIDHTSFKKFVFYIFIIWIYGMILDLIIMAFTSLVLHFFKIEPYWYIFEITITIIVAITLVVISHNKRLKKITNNLFDKLCKIKFLDLSLILFSIFIFSIGIPIFLNLHHLNISFLLIIIMFLIILVFGILIKYRISVVENTIFLKNLKENNEFYIKMEDENRIFRHNLNAKLLSIKSVSNAKAKALLDELLKENNYHVKYLGNVRAIPYGFNGIIYEKIYPYLKTLDVKIENQINYDIFMMLTPRRYNVLVEKMVIALDNAIEACNSSKEKALVINMDIEDNGIMIEIKNTFSSNVNLENLGNIGYSTKGKKRGLGLFSSFRNNEATLEVKIVNDLFVTKICAKKNLSN